MTKRPSRPVAGSVFAGRFPQVEYEPLAAAFTESRRRHEILQDLRDDREQLLRDGAATRASRLAVLDKVVQGAAPESELPPDKEQEFEVALSDVEQRIALAERSCHQHDEAVMRVCTTHADAILADAVEADSKIRTETKAAYAKFAQKYSELLEVEAKRRWLTRLTSDEMAPWNGRRSAAAPEIAAIGNALEGPADAAAAEQRVRDYVGRVGLKPLEASSMVPWKVRPSDVAIEVGVSLDVAKHVIARMRREAEA